MTLAQTDIDDTAERLREAESILVVIHTHADADSAGSAVAFVAGLTSSVDIAAPSSVKANARPVLELSDNAVVNEPVVDEYDVTIIVDAPTSDRIGSVDVLGRQTSLILIDHHSRGDLADAADIALVDPDASATAVLVYRVLSVLPASVSTETAVGLAAGILADTNYLADGSTQAVKIALDLLSHVEPGPHADVLVQLCEEESDFSERVSTAKAVARADGYKSRHTLLMLTHCGSDQAAAADALINAGADIALVLTERGDEIWVVGRLSSREDTVNLPRDVFEPLVKEHGGESGGHADAGTAKLNTTVINVVEDDCLRTIEQALGRTFGPLK